MQKIPKRRILFVCKGNKFRSMAAEYCLNNFLKKNGINDASVSSAGLVLDKRETNPIIFKVLKGLGINAERHECRKLTKRDLLNSDLVIAMTEEQKDAIKNEYGFGNAVLFNMVANGEETSVRGINDIIKNQAVQKKAVVTHIKKTIFHINRSIPKLYRRLDNYLLFSDFASRRKTLNHGFPVMPIHETKHSMAFMSIAIPEHTDGHILVVPKKRYQNLDDIPGNELKDLIGVVSIVGRAVRGKHGGYNVLLNNGSAAGQFIQHTHFHVIPRNKGDGIKIEIWKNRRLTRTEYIDFNLRLKKAVGLILKRGAG